MEFDLDYTDENCISSTSPGNLTCADLLQNANYTGANCTCVKNFTLENDFQVCRCSSSSSVWIDRFEMFFVRAMFISITVW